MARKEQTYDEAQIAERLRELPGWYYEDGWIRRVYKTDGWPTTLMLVNAIGYLSEAAYHHPDLSVTWGARQVKLSTHSAGGITDKDFELARRIEDVVLWRPAAGGALDGHAEQVRASGDPRWRSTQIRSRSRTAADSPRACSVRHRPARRAGAAARARRDGRRRSRTTWRCCGSPSRR